MAQTSIFWSKFNILVALDLENNAKVTKSNHLFPQALKWV